MHKRAVPPSPFPEVSLPKERWPGLAATILGDLSHSWDVACTSGSTDRMWRVIQHAATRWHFGLAQAPFRPRARPRVSWAPDEPYRTHRGDTASLAAGDSLLFARRLHQWRVLSLAG